MSGATDAVTHGRSPALRRLFEALAEAWRERRSERRAMAVSRGVADPHVPRSRIGAALEARLAVRAGVRLDDFLRHRLAKYAVRLPVPLEDLPVTIDVDAGDMVIRPRHHARPPSAGQRPDPAAGASPEPPGPPRGRDVRDAEEALHLLDGRAAQARSRLDAIEGDLAKALASGQLASWPDVDATPEQLGRPPVPSPTPVQALRGFVAALLAAEAWRFSGPVLAASGITPDGLEAALRATPVPAVLGLVFALGAAAAVFSFAGVALARAAEAASSGGASGKRPLLGLTAAGAALLAVGVTAAAAAPARWAHLALLVTVPFAGALLWRAASRLDARRASALEAALVWDRERTREALERGRREEIREHAAAELRAIEDERALARRKVLQLHRLAIAAERGAGLASRAEARRLDRLSEGLASALELDRYLYIRLAAERSPSVARPARPTRLDGAVTERLGVAG
jgi:hypothetical protein